MKKLAIIGQYGEGPDYLTGQAVKTLATGRWMLQRLGAEEVEIVNTYGWRKHPFGLLLSVVKAMRTCKNAIILPAQHGVKVFPSLVAGLNRLYHRRIFFIVIGGWLAETLAEKPGLRRTVAAFDGVYAETESLARDLLAVGVPNAKALPNYRAYQEVPPKPPFTALPYKVCTYSRVTEEKGIADAVDIVKRANALLGEQVFTLEVYGAIDPDYRAAFSALCRQESACLTYCGTRKADETLDTLKDQFAILFPTYYKGECFAGTALDAFLSHTPMIANDWKYNREVIHDGENGLLYPYRDTEAAARKLAALYRDPALYARLQAGCDESAHAYDADRVLETLVRDMA